LIERERSRILPAHVRVAENNFDLDSDLVAHPLKYLTKMIYMMKVVEGADGKLLSIFPTVDTNIPGHLILDTTTVLNLLYNTTDGYLMERTNNKKKGKTIKDGWLEANQDLIWDLFFKVKENRQLFHSINFNANGEPVFINNNDGVRVPVYCDNSDYCFHHQLKTDGVAVSIILVKKTHAHLNHPHNPPTVRGRRDPDDVYIDRLSDQQKVQYQEHEIVGVDPNKRDLLFCVNSNEKGNNQKKMRYTSDQRKKEKKTKNNQRLMRAEKREEIVDGESIEQHEAALSNFNSKTVDFDRYQAYVTEKNNCNFNTKEFYHRTKYRERRFKTYTSTQKSNSKLIKSIRKTLGGPASTLVAIGDWTDGNHHRRFNEPVIGIGLRKILRKGGYKVFLVNEFRTSRMCSECQGLGLGGGILEKFRWVRNPRPYKQGNILCNGLLRCTTCKGLWNRDLNAAINIYNIAYNAVHGHPRPLYLQRPNQQNQNVAAAVNNEYDE
jgi:hypothetical protein